MNNREKKQFVSELLHEVETKILNQIDNDQIPDNWDGFELRALISEKLS